jgi:hypothetical protein
MSNKYYSSAQGPIGHGSRFEVHEPAVDMADQEVCRLIYLADGSYVSN